MNKRLSYFLLILLSGQVIFAQQKTRLINDREFLKQDTGGIWEAVGLIGDDKLADNQGTSSGSGYVQLYNGHSIVSAKAESVPTVFLNL